MQASVKKIVKERLDYLIDTIGMSAVDIASEIHQKVKLSESQAAQKIRDIRSGRSSGNSTFLNALTDAFPDQVLGTNAKITYVEDRIERLELELKQLKEENEQERKRLLSIIENLTKSQ